jgi:hypothetical protein
LIGVDWAEQPVEDIAEIPLEHVHLFLGDGTFSGQSSMTGSFSTSKT